MTEIKPWSEAPAGTYNPFANDARCYAVHYVVGDEAEDVAEELNVLFVHRSKEFELSDYDMNYDSTIEKWVGVTCRDHD